MSFTRARHLALGVALAVLGLASACDLGETGDDASQDGFVPGPPARLQLVGPTRVLDAAISSSSVQSIDILGPAGSVTGVRGVAINVAIDAPTTSGWVRVRADGDPEPETASF